MDPKTGEAVEDGVLVLDGGKVAAVGTRDETRKAVAAVAGRAQVLDATGRWMLPGLIDVHVHAKRWPMPGPYCRAVPRASAAVQALSTRMWPSPRFRPGPLESLRG